MKLAVLILAAGQGKRMKSALPKVLQPLAGKPLLSHVVSRARTLEPSSIHVVYGHGGDAVRAALAQEDLHWALQAEQLGTGHAVMQAMPGVTDDELVLVLYGDVPLIRPDTLRELVALAGARSMSLLTVMLTDPTGYGRIVRDRRGRIQKIVEQKDANKAQLRIREGNSGIMAVPARLLRRWLGKLKNSNAQGEYYLTDIIAMAVKDKVKVTPLIAPTIAEVLGVNDKVQLAELEALHRADRARELMVAGATVVDPGRIDVRGEVTLGRDVVFEPNVLLEGQATSPSAPTASSTQTPSSSRASSEPDASSGLTRACARARNSVRRCTSATSSSSRRPSSPMAARPITSRISAMHSSVAA
jgi:bifunctional UDP-N-acetylglucosamine pyrophosphorylase/glucosamine-1-phosphate N-acetyltransferase